MSRIVRFAQTGGPEVLKIEEVELPTPGPGEVRLAVKAIGLNRAESMWRNGAYVETPAFPARLGYEAAGIIEAVGPGVKGLAVGDTVSVVPGFSQHKYGTYGERVLMPAAMVVHHPSSLSFVEAASIWMMFITAYGSLIETAHLSKGQTVVIPGASSSVGLAAIQIANAVGAIPIAVTRSPTKRQKLLDAGAKHVIATDEQDLLAEILNLTNGKGANVVFDPVAGPNFSKLIQGLRTKGKMVLYGALSTEATEIPVLTMLTKFQTIYAYGIFETTYDPSRQAAAVKFVLNGFESGAFSAVVDKVFPFDQVVDAHRHLESNTQFGKVVMKVGD